MCLKWHIHMNFYQADLVHFCASDIVGAFENSDIF